jgi:uncharacterized PurR-regulated membrane protein YhhQ (DUF165 family)
VPGGFMLKLIAALFVMIVAVDVYLHGSPLNAIGVFSAIGFFYLAISFLMEELAAQDD